MKNEKDGLEEVLEASIEAEEALMRTYLINAERVQDDDELKERLENFAQGNAKRTKQLIDELHEMEEEENKVTWGRFETTENINFSVVSNLPVVSFSALQGT